MRELSYKQFQAFLKTAAEASGSDKVDRINDLRKLVFTISTDTLVDYISGIRSIDEVNTLLAVGLTSRSNEAAMQKRALLRSHV